MAILKPLNGKGRYRDTNDRERVTEYILNPQKTPHRLIGGIQVNPEDIGQKYQAIFAVHENTANLHLHLMLNSISYIDGHRYYGTKRDYYTLLNCIKSVLRSYGIYKLMAVSPLSEKDIQD